MNAPVSNVRSMQPVDTFEVCTVSHYARGYGMLAGMIETIRLTHALNNDDEVRTALDKALEFIAEHDGKAPVPHIPHQAITQSRGGVR